MSENSCFQAEIHEATLSTLLRLKNLKANFIRGFNWSSFGAIW